MLHRRREGEYHRVGLNWQWDRGPDRLWIALAIRIPYWIFCFTTWYSPLYGEEKIVSLEQNLTFGLAYAVHSRKFHRYWNHYKTVWREFGCKIDI